MTYLAALTPALALGPDWLNPDSLLKMLGTWALWGAAAIIFAECGLLIGFFFPGDSLLFTVGLFVGAEAIKQPLWLCCLVLTVAAFAGNVVGYHIGRPAGPSIPADVTGQELDKEIRNDLRTLSLEAAEIVSRHLVMTARLLDDRPDLAWEHAKAAVARGGRLAVVREAAGIAAYTAGEYADALAQFRAARRISGSDSYWPIMADCERGLGRPERAISMAGADEVDRLDRAGRVEMRIVASGARRDLGQLDAAVVTLQCPELSSSSTESWSARLKFAYADALLAAGREDEAREWFAKTVEVDASDETDAAERLADLDGIVWVDTLDGDQDDDASDDGEFVTDAVDFDEDEDDEDEDEDDEDDEDDDDNVGEFAPPALDDVATVQEPGGLVEDVDVDTAHELDIDDLALAGDDPADYAHVLRDQDVPDSSSD